MMACQWEPAPERALKGEEFGLDKVQSILRQSLDGLEAAHALGIELRPYMGSA